VRVSEATIVCGVYGIGADCAAVHARGDTSGVFVAE